MGLLGRLSVAGSSAVAPAPKVGRGNGDQGAVGTASASDKFGDNAGKLGQVQAAQPTTASGLEKADMDKAEAEKAAFHRHMQFLYDKGKATRELNVDGWRGKVKQFKRRILCQRDPSLGPTPKRRWSPFRQFVSQLVHNHTFNNFIFFVIFLNSILITLQMEESSNLVYAYYFDVFDKVLMAVYIVELVMKMYALQERFLLSGWNIFDAIIVFISIVETLLYTVLNDSSNISPAIFRLFRIFKALKAMRALKALSFLKNLQVIVSTLLKSIPAMGSIIMLLLLILYIFAIIFVTLYEDILPDQFGDLGVASFTLFQLITLDDWSEYEYMVKRSHKPEMAPLITSLMALYIILETFICINLFIAVIVNNLERANMRERQRKKRKLDEELNHEKNQANDESKKRRGRRRKRAQKNTDGNAKGSAAQDNLGTDSNLAGGAPGSTAVGAGATTSVSNQATGDGTNAGDPKLGQPENAKRKKKISDSDDDDSDYEDDLMLGNKTPSEAFINDPSAPLWQRELQPEILALLASLDHNVNILHRHQSTLDELVDVIGKNTGQKLTKKA